jgi:hypothetical protein
MASLYPIDRKDEFLRQMQQAATEAAGALNEVCMVLDGIALDMTFARHASRTPLRLSSQRVENVARTLLDEANASSPIGARHASVIGKVTLAAATISVLPFAEDAGRVAMQRFRASHERATSNLDEVSRFADRAQTETRRDLSLQIAALVGELDHLAGTLGFEMTEHRRELEEAMGTQLLPARWSLDGLDHVLGQVRMELQPVSDDGDRSTSAGSTSGHLNRLAEIEFMIAEIFAQLTGDAP